jgi:hypothetical protein
MKLRNISLIVLSVSTVACSLLPAMATPVNVKLGDLAQPDLDAYCSSMINFSNGKIMATLADTHVNCQVSISVSGSTQAEAEGNALLSARNASLQGSIGASGQYGSQWLATFNSFQKSYHLTNWCRQKYSPNFYLPNPINGVGRIFVGDGGHACYKTEDR